MISSRSAGKRPKRSRSWDLSDVLFNYVLPGALIIVMGGGMAYLGYFAYKGVTSSGFFAVREVETNGLKRVPREDVMAVVEKYSNGLRTAWEADLGGIRDAIAERSEVKSVSVSRLLPDVISVTVREREPRAVVRRGDELFWADDEGAVVGVVRKGEQRPALVMTGWDDSGGGRPSEVNRRRVEVYRTVSHEWSDFNLIERVRELDTSNLNEIKAVIEEGGRTVEVNLGKVDFGKRLKTAIEAVAGRGGEIRAISMKGDQPVVTLVQKDSARPKGGKDE